MSIADLRREYAAGSLRRADLSPDPLAQFSRWFDQALETKTPGNLFRRIGIASYKWFQTVLGNAPVETNAMTLATADTEGHPSARMVLLKGCDERGFVFFTQYQSRKGHDLAENPQAALVFYWPELERQVCVSGRVSKLPPEESEAYFKSRPKGSRLAAWVARQSAVVAGRIFLEERMQQLQKQFPDEVPRPDYWGGHVLSPSRIEFWQGRLNRLHDRFQYTKQADGSWRIERLAP
jgi:pyridoxamine 5'-phosphate oxidase